MTLRVVTVVSILFWAAAPVAAQSYIGAERCKSCHEFAFRQWKNGPHSGAQEALSGDQRKDPKCNTCHTTLPDQQEDRLVGVQCERCHGPGRYYHRSYVMKDRELARAVGLIEPKPEHCTQCHTEGAPSIEPFEFAAMWARIDHGKAARLKWEEERGGKAAEGEGRDAR